MKRIIVVAVLALGGCHITDVFSSPPQSFVAPDGRPGYLLRCGGITATMATCYTNARAACGGDYEVLNQSVTPRDDTATENRTLQVACKASSSAPLTSR